MNEKVIQCFKDKKILCPIFAGILSLFLISIIVYFAVLTQQKIKQGKHIDRWNLTVTETGEVYAKPDLAIVELSVIAEKPNATDALTASADRMNAVIGFVKEKGVDEKDIKTTRFNISPRYEYYDEYGQRIFYYEPTGKRILVGYEVTQTLQVKIREMAKIGEILQGATEAGVNDIGNLYFTIDKQDEFKKQAREEAIKKAKEKAKELASQAGVKLVRIANISEYGFTPYPYYDYGLTKEAVGLGGGAPAIETGENKITVTVTIIYEVE